MRQSGIRVEHMRLVGPLPREIENAEPYKVAIIRFRVSIAHSNNRRQEISVIHETR